MRLLFLLLLPLLHLVAQPWDTLHGLRNGDRIRVLEIAGTETKGTFSSVTADAITLHTDRGEVAVERARVRRVQVRSSARRVRNLAIGAAIGLVVGVVTDQTLGAYLRNEVGETAGTRAVIYVAPIALFGGIAGAFPAYRTVFKR